jgi:hypothetical protein
MVWLLYGKVRRIDIIEKSEEREGKESNLFLISGPLSNRKNKAITATCLTLRM